MSKKHPTQIVQARIRHPDGTYTHIEPSRFVVDRKAGKIKFDDDLQIKEGEKLQVGYVGASWEPAFSYDPPPLPPAPPPLNLNQPAFTHPWKISGRMTMLHPSHEIECCRTTEEAQKKISELRKQGWLHLKIIAR